MPWNYKAMILIAMTIFFIIMVITVGIWIQGRVSETETPSTTNTATQQAPVGNTIR